MCARAKLGVIEGVSIIYNSVNLGYSRASRLTLTSNARVNVVQGVPIRQVLALVLPLYTIINVAK